MFWSKEKDKIYHLIIVDINTTTELETRVEQRAIDLIDSTDYKNNKDIKVITVYRGDNKIFHFSRNPNNA